MLRKRVRAALRPRSGFVPADARRRRRHLSTRSTAAISLSIDLQGFHGDDFDVGVSVSLVRSTFVVSKPPHREDGRMKMTVDGVELTRTE